jgi:polyphosphate kinase 2 (PPK2 family)
MFVLSEKGQVYMYKLVEHMPQKGEVDMLGTKA